MTDKEGMSEIVIFFDGDEIACEMLFEDFETLLDRSEKIDAFAGSVVSAAFVAVSGGLVVRGIVFFKLKVDEEGLVESGFNLPLQYLLVNAGQGPDLGSGPIRIACRGQCSVPWHANDLWEPDGDGEDHAAHKIQKAVWRNRLGLKIVNHQTGTDVNEFEATGIELNDDLHRQLESALDDDGRVDVKQLVMQYNQQIDELRKRLRKELDEQQQTYLDQARSHRNEIHRLKTELRHEQNRYQQLQRILRGDVGGSL